MHPVLGGELLLQRAEPCVERRRLAETFGLDAIVRPHHNQDVFACAAIEPGLQAQRVRAPFIQPNHAELFIGFSAGILKVGRQRWASFPGSSQRPAFVALPDDARPLGAVTCLESPKPRSQLGFHHGELFFKGRSAGIGCQRFRRGDVGSY